MDGEERWIPESGRSDNTTHVAELNMRMPDMSTKWGLYPHAGLPYPHSLACTGRASTGGRSGSVGVEEFAKCPDIPAEIVVVSHLSLDLLAAV